MDNKKKLIFLGLDVLVLIVTIGVSLAVFNYVKKGENPNRVTAGAITMNFTEGVRNINLPVATPTSDEEGRNFGLDGSTCQNDSDNNVQCYTDFTVSTNMSINYNIGYEVTLEKDEATTLGNDDVRVYLEKLDENDEYKEVFSPKAFEEIDSENPNETDELGASNSDMLLDSGSITSSTTYNYRLRIWLSSDYTFTNETKNFVGKINVYGSNVEVNASTGITLDKTTLTMQKGTTNTLTATIKPDNAKNKNLIWESSNPNVVKVDSAGNLTAVEVGTSIITIRTSDRSYSASATITVVNYKVKSVELNTKEVTLSKGNTYPLTATVTPSDAEDTSVEYTSSSKGIATVSNDGLINAVGVGEAIITVTTKNGITDTCKVIVTEPNVETIAINGDDSVDVGDVITLTTSITTTSGTTPTDIVWTSSDESKAIVSSTGKVTGIELTEEDNPVTITAYVKSQPDLTATKTIEVQYPEIETITMSSDMTINYGNTTTFSIWINPNQVRNQDKIRWTSSNTSVATIPSSCSGSLSCSPTIINDGTSTIKAVVVKVVGDEEVETSILDTATLTINFTTMRLSSYITELYDKEGAKTASNLTSATTLFSDSTSDNNIRYTGANPNNYVWFNCDSDSTNCERWRIIGVMNNVKSSVSSNGETRVKLMRSDSIGYFSLHSEDLRNKSFSWDDLHANTILNDLYYNMKIGTCYHWTNSTKECDFRTTGIKAATKNLIKDALWMTNVVGWSDTYTPSEFYTAENNGNSYWIGKIGLIYASEYAYSSYLCMNSNSSIMDSGDTTNSMSNCGNDRYMSNADQWTMTLLSTDFGGTWKIYRMSGGGSLMYGNHPATYGKYFFPTLYLKSNVVVKQDGADGSYDKPYNIALDS